jgi:RibD C-terminal domain
MESDLVDQINLMIFAVILGTGKKVFEEKSERRNLKLTESKVVGNGVVVLIYERARVATEGGAQLPAQQGEDGLWEGGALFPRRSSTRTKPALDDPAGTAGPAVAPAHGHTLGQQHADASWAETVRSAAAAVPRRGGPFARRARRARGAESAGYLRPGAW